MTMVEAIPRRYPAENATAETNNKKAVSFKVLLSDKKERGKRNRTTTIKYSPTQEVYIEHS